MFLGNLLTKIDQFGVSLTPSIKTDKKQYKSMIGGVTSVFIYTLSLAYFLYIISQWSQNLIQPKITSTKKLIEYNEVMFEKSPFSISLLAPFTVPFVFGKDENIFMPSFMDVQGTTTSSLTQFFPSEAKNGDQSYSLELDNFKLVLNSNQNPEEPELKETQRLVLYQGCQTQILDTCASNQQTENLFKTPFLTQKIKINLQQYNEKTRQIETIPKQYYSPLERSQTLFSQVLLQTAKIIVNDGILFPHETTHHIISQVVISSTFLPFSYSKLAFGPDAEVFSLSLIKIDSIQEVIYISEPQLGEILAQIGSIVSMLMLVKVLVVALNEKQLEKFLVDEIIAFYFPEFRNLVITQNLKGIVTNVQTKDKKRKYNPILVNQFYQKAQEIAKVKLNYTNLIFEISRLQFIVQHFHPREVIKKIKDVGIEIPQALFQETRKRNSPIQILNQVQNISVSTPPDVFPEENVNIDSRQSNGLMEEDMSLLLFESKLQLEEQLKIENLV